LLKSAKGINIILIIVLYTGVFFIDIPGCCSYTSYPMKESSSKKNDAIIVSPTPFAGVNMADHVSKTVAYIQLSNNAKDVNAQHRSISNYARKKGFKIDEYVESEIPDITKFLKRGDTLVVADLSHLNTSILSIVDILAWMVHHHISIVAMTQNLSIKADRDAAVIEMLLKALANLDKKIQRRKIKLGMTRARKKGKTIGRPPGKNPEGQEA
jgi:DNA invertase Pin-like site-specific DNA recombinase